MRKRSRNPRIASGTSMILENKATIPMLMAHTAVPHVRICLRVNFAPRKGAIRTPRI